MNSGDLVSVNGYLYEFVEKARSWKGYVYICRSLITDEAVIQIPRVVKKAKTKDVLNFLNKFIG